MKANELRYGNLVNYEGELMMIHPHDIQVLITDKKPFTEKYTPIRLTPEKLIEFGFKKHGDNCFRLGHMKFNYQKLPKGATGHDRVFVYGTIILTHIYYIHQFQNLYFSLTGEELKIKQ